MTFVGDERFDSRREADHWRKLCLLQRAGEIEHLKRQPRFAFYVNGKKLCEYRADFSYLDKRTGEQQIVDVKGHRTPMYLLKRKLMAAALGIEIQEV